MQIVLCRLGPQVGIVQYGQRVVQEFALDDYHSVEEVVRAAKNIEQRGGEETRTALGISNARYPESPNSDRTGTTNFTNRTACSYRTSNTNRTIRFNRTRNT